MYCRNCGALNDDNAWKCVACGQVLHHDEQESQVQMPAEPIPNYLVQAILVTVCCCLPFGIPAIVFAAQANAKAAVGDIQGALDASDKAKTWTWVSFGCGLVFTLV
jgi:uncharacterized membrane protein YvbJ